MRRFQTRTDLGLHHAGMDTAVFGDLFGGLDDFLLRGSSFQATSRPPLSSNGSVHPDSLVIGATARQVTTQTDA